jgi:hypothetical protein
MKLACLKVTEQTNNQIKNNDMFYKKCDIFLK